MNKGDQFKAPRDIEDKWKKGEFFCKKGDQLEILYASSPTYVVQNNKTNKRFTIRIEEEKKPE
jgi:hypothetical protein